MTKYMTPIAIAFFLASGVANANIVKTGNQAVTVCKAHIKENVPGYKVAKLSKVRNSSLQHKVTFSVTADAGRTKTLCLVNKQDGVVELKY